MKDGRKNKWVKQLEKGVLTVKRVIYSKPLGIPTSTTFDAGLRHNPTNFIGRKYTPYLNNKEFTFYGDEYTNPMERVIARIISQKPTDIRSASRNFLRKQRRTQDFQLGATGETFDASWAKSTRNCIVKHPDLEDVTEIFKTNPRIVNRTRLKKLPLQLNTKATEELYKDEVKINVEELLKARENTSVDHKKLPQTLLISPNTGLNRSDFMKTYKKRHPRLTSNEMYSEKEQNAKYLGREKVRRKMILEERKKLSQTLQYREMMMQFRQKFDLSEKQLIELVNQYKILISLKKGKIQGYDTGKDPTDFLTSCKFCSK